MFCHTGIDTIRFFDRNSHFPTVLRQNYYTHRMLQKSTSSSPITLVFTDEPCYIYKFLWKKKLGRTPKNNPPFPRFFKKNKVSKSTFFPSWQKFRTSIFEKRPNSSIFGVPNLENFFCRNFDNKTPTYQKFWSGPSPSTFYGLFSKKRFSDFFSDFPRKPMNSRVFCGKWTKFGCNFPRKNMKKYENLKNAFSNIRPKISMGRSPIKMFF